MELVVAHPGGGNTGTPFQRHDVREWHHVDPRTGDLMCGRLEADRWSTGPNNRYGKVVDSRNLTGPDGRLQTQRKQLEVLQTRTSEGSLQVVRSKTVSSTRWSSNHGQDHSGIANKTQPMKLTNAFPENFEDIKMQKHRPLNVTSKRINDIVGDSNSAVTYCAPPQNRTSSPQVNNVTDNQPVSNGPSTARSNSTEDLSSLERNEDDYEQIGEWRRISKIRRSLQFPRTSKPAPTIRRPPDLPENLVSVSKIRQELENAKRLGSSTVGKPADSVTLNSILQNFSDASSETSVGKHTSTTDATRLKSNSAETSTKRHSFITVDSLKDMRGRLRRLSNESGSTELMHSDADDSIITEEPERAEEMQPDQGKSRVRSYVFGMESSLNTGSLESRKSRENDDWHIRRKSYGFEGVLPQHAEQISRADISTDSGIYHSTELNSTYEGTIPLRGTVITLGKNYEANLYRMNEYRPSTSQGGVVTTIPVTQTSPMLGKRLFHRQLSEGTTMSVESQIAASPKRHSIATDESRYLKRNDENGYNVTQFDEDDNMSLQGKGNKKVVFSKTEVHFAADSGRVNIVETDEKPPPTQNFRRRRRNSSNSISPPESSKSNLPLIHFGDTDQAKFAEEKRSIERFTETEIVPPANPFSNLEAEDDQRRGILKNKPIRPKSYHLGEEPGISEGVWGIRLKSIGANVLDTNDSESSLASSFPTVKQNSFTSTSKTDFFLDTNESEVVAQQSSWTVADRIRAVEEKKTGGFSTKINFGSGEPIVESRVPNWSPTPLKDAENPNTTTKISISLSPMSASEQSSYSKVLEVSESLKSTSLIMQTIQTKESVSEGAEAVITERTSKGGLSQQLSELRLLYEADSDDSARADEEVKSLLQPVGVVEDEVDLEESGSVLSGSWSRMRAIRSVKQHLKQFTDSLGDGDVESEKHLPTWPDREHQKVSTAKQPTSGTNTSGVTSISLRFNSGTGLQKSTVTTNSNVSVTNLKSESSDRNGKKSPELEKIKSISARKNELNRSFRREKSPQQTVSKVVNQRDKSPKETAKLKAPTSGTRQLREHELSYFGVKVPKKTEGNKQYLMSSDKPDLLRHSPRPTKNPVTSKDTVEYANISVLKSRERSSSSCSIKKQSITPEKREKNNKTESSPSVPIYENINIATHSEHVESDSIELEELTKAADEILQAVTGYTSEESHDESRHRRSKTQCETLEVIAEHTTTPKKVEKGVQVSRTPRESLRRLLRSTASKGSSSQSSRSTSHRSVTPQTGNGNHHATTKSSEAEKHRTGAGSSTSTTNQKSKERNRRLQRVSSREALLQSTRGSSDEDTNVPTDAPPRRPRRSKTKEKASEKTTAPLTEYRHKTVTSTIRSVAEKAASKSSRKHTEERGKTKRK